MRSYLCTVYPRCALIIEEIVGSSEQVELLTGWIRCSCRWVTGWTLKKKKGSQKHHSCSRKIFRRSLQRQYYVAIHTCKGKWGGEFFLNNKNSIYSKIAVGYERNKAHDVLLLIKSNPPPKQELKSETGESAPAHTEWLMAVRLWWWFCIAWIEK